MIYLLCGVPGSGKTWVIEQLFKCRPPLGFTSIEHDSISREKLLSLAKSLYPPEHMKRSLIIDCPFDERSLRSELERLNLKVTPIFIVEHPSVIEVRYFKREGKRPSQSILTRAETIMNKVNEWGAFYGTSDEVFRHLKGIL